MTKDPANDNDYAIARELHDRACKLLGAVHQLSQVYNHDDPYSEYHQVIVLINRPYVLVVHELEKLYAKNKTLAKLNEESKTNATWTSFNTIESSDQEIYLYLNKHKRNEDFAHLSQVSRLAIIAGMETATFTPEQQKIIDEADEVFVTSMKRLGEWSARRPKKQSKGFHYIMNYKLKYEDNGSIVINDVLVLKKTQSGSAPRKLMEQALKHPYELFKPELGQLSRNLSNVLSDMGITGTLKELFFPIASKDGVKFRPSVNFTTAEEERIDTQELENKLKVLGAKTATALDNNISEEPMDDQTKALLEEYERNEKERKKL